MITLLILVVQVFLLYFFSRKILGKLSRFPTLVFAVIFFPGTVIHELSHWIMAKILFVPTGKLSLKPQVFDHGIKLGSLEIAKVDQLRRTMIGISPLIIGIALIFSVFFIKPWGDISGSLFLIIQGVLIFEIANTMFSSKKDLEGSYIVLILLVALYIGLYAIGVRIDLEFLLSGKVLETISRANYALLVANLIDLILVLLLKIV